MQNQSQLALIQGKPLTLPDLGHAVTDKYTLVGARRYVAAKAGLSKDDIEGKTMKEVKDLAVAAGHTDDEVKLWRKEYDAAEKEHRKFSRIANSLMSTDPNFRQSWRPTFNKSGEFIGAHTTFRREKASSAVSRAEVAEARVLELESKLTKLMALLPASA